MGRSLFGMVRPLQGAIRLFLGMIQYFQGAVHRFPGTGRWWMGTADLFQGTLLLSLGTSVHPKERMARSTQLWGHENRRDRGGAHRLTGNPVVLLKRVICQDDLARSEELLPVIPEVCGVDNRFVTLYALFRG